VPSVSNTYQLDLHKVGAVPCEIAHLVMCVSQRFYDSAIPCNRPSLAESLVDSPLLGL
jgi:hypothetical protein